MDLNKVLMIGGIICSGAGMILSEITKNENIKKEVTKQVAKAVEGLK